MPAGSHPDAAALDVLAGVLGDTPSGRLYKALVDNKKAVGAGMGLPDLHDPGFIMASVRLSMDQSLDEARQILLKTVEGVVTEPPTKEEVERAKTRMLKQYRTGDERIRRPSRSISASTPRQGDWRLLFLDARRHQEGHRGRRAARRQGVSEGIQPHARPASSRPRTRTAPKFRPRPISLRAQGFQGRRSGRRTARRSIPLPPISKSRVVRSTLPDGMKMSLLSRRRPAAARWSLRSPSASATRSRSSGNRPSPQITGGLLMRGTKNKSRQQIQDEIDRLKAQHQRLRRRHQRHRQHRDHRSQPARRAAPGRRDPARAVLPRERIRDRPPAAHRRRRSRPSDPQALAFTGVPAAIMKPYPRGDLRYVSTADEQIEDLKKVTLDDVRKFHQQFYGASASAKSPSPASSTRPRSQKLADRTLRQLEESRRRTRASLSLTEGRAASTGKSKRPTSRTPSSSPASCSRCSDEDPDYPAMLLANYMFGGSGLGTRLFAPHPR